MRSHWTEIEKYLEDQKVAQELIGELRDFHMRYEVEDQVKERVEKPDMAVMNWMWIFRDLRKMRSALNLRTVPCPYLQLRVLIKTRKIRKVNTSDVNVMLVL